MNIGKFLIRILSGPLFFHILYGDLLTLLVVYSGFAPIAGYTISAPMIAIIVAMLSFALNFYQTKTQTVVKNGIFATPSQEIKDLVEKIAHEEQVRKFTLQEITNLSVPIVLVSKMHPSLEIYYSSEYADETLQKLVPFLIKSGIKRSKQILGYLVWASISFGILAFSLRMALIFLRSLPLSTFWFWVSWIFCVQVWVMGRRFFLATIKRDIILTTDEKTAQELGFTEAINTLEELDTLTKYDANTAQFADWEMTTPKHSTRIENLRSKQN